VYTDIEEPPTPMSVTRISPYVYLFARYFVSEFRLQHTFKCRHHSKILFKLLTLV